MAVLSQANLAAIKVQLYKMSPTLGYNPEGKRAIITGGAQGIGYEFTVQLFSAGTKVCISDIDAPGGKDAAEKLRQMYPDRKDRYDKHFLKYTTY